MMPHEAQATMAKILFFVFAIFVLCLNNTRADSDHKTLLSQPSVSVSVSY